MPGPIPQFIKNRFTRIQNAYEEGFIVMAVVDKQTGKDRYLICSTLQMGDEVIVAPLGEVFDAERQDVVHDEVVPD